MKSHAVGTFLMTTLLFLSLSAHAQNPAPARTPAQADTSPQEAPFIQEDKEFDDAFKAEQTATQPANKKSVNLNESVPEAGSTQIPQSAPSQAQPQRPYAPVSDSGDSSIGEAPHHVTDDKPPVLPPDEKVIQRDDKHGVEYIQHPQAAKGLVVIEEDGTYVYHVKEVNTYSASSSVRFGLQQAPAITAANNKDTFASIYGGGDLFTIMYDYEMQPFDHISQFKLAAGFNLSTASGNGRFLNPQNSFYCPPYPAATCNNYPNAMEKYTFLSLPVTAGFVYRFQYANRQWMAPYIGAGGTYYLLGELRDDGKYHAVGTPGGYAEAGMLFNITAIDTKSAFTLNTEYGVNNLWLDMQVRVVQTVNKDLNMSADIFSVGFMVDY